VGWLQQPLGVVALKALSALKKLQQGVGWLQQPMGVVALKALSAL